MTADREAREGCNFCSPTKETGLRTLESHLVPWGQLLHFASFCHVIPHRFRALLLMTEPRRARGAQTGVLTAHRSTPAPVSGHWCAHALASCSGTPELGACRVCLVCVLSQGRADSPGAGRACSC